MHGKGDFLMRYLTQEWYKLCRKTDLHYGLEVHPLAGSLSDTLFTRLYQEKEDEYLNLKRELYHTNPRLMLEIDPQVTDSDKKDPFNHEDAIIDFREQFKQSLGGLRNLLSPAIYEQIADPRLYALGYCTEEILDLVTAYSQANEAEVNRILEAFEVAQRAEDLPAHLAEDFGAHNAKVLKLEKSEDLVLKLDPSGSFTDCTEISFINADIKKIEGTIEGSYWIYSELYRADVKYEAHILFSGDSIGELVVTCDEILMN